MLFTLHEMNSSKLFFYPLYLLWRTCTVCYESDKPVCFAWDGCWGTHSDLEWHWRPGGGEERAAGARAGMHYWARVSRTRIRPYMNLHNFTQRVWQCLLTQQCTLIYTYTSALPDQLIHLDQWIHSDQLTPLPSTHSGSKNIHLWLSD